MKEMCIDFRKNQRCPKLVYIKGEAAEWVDTYKYLGVVFDSKLNWKENINSAPKKLNLRMFCMRKPRSSEVNSDMLVIFYNAVICSIIMFGSVFWGGNTSKLDRGKLKKTVKKRSSCCGKAIWTVLRLYTQKKRPYRKLMQILYDPTHPMRHYFDSRHSNRSRRFLLLRTNTNRYKALFLPSTLSA